MAIGITYSALSDITIQLFTLLTVTTCWTLLTENFPLQVQSGSYWKTLGAKEKNQLLITYNSLRNGYTIFQVKIANKRFLVMKFS